MAYMPDERRMQAMADVTVSNAHSTYSGYQSLVRLYEATKGSWGDTISVELAIWFNANLAAPLGAILDGVVESLNEVSLDKLPPEIKTILQKNGFLAHFGYPALRDTNDTTIKYLKLRPSDGRYFNQYVLSELLGRSELPTLSADLRKKIAESIYEIFVNAQTHSETRHNYTCGQFFPQRNTIEFTICDAGIGFRTSIKRRFGKDLPAKRAIQWATAVGHTTKSDTPGGIGLAIMKEFIAKNRGALQIVSNDGFYELNESGENLRDFNGEFPGTIVTMIINTNDRFSYGVAEAEATYSVF